jgi:hypothetical protein
MLLRLHCVGGPHGDFWHEVHGSVLPNRIGLPDDDGVLRWYDVVDGVAVYSQDQAKFKCYHCGEAKPLDDMSHHQDVCRACYLDFR